ncbi:MAG TPA: hypothetical protein VMV12_02630 [Candidatus Micrarchaeaceae archaeon]|nr:hypothetical protein [Candidatus Micrarchaeaceae archaeon]
MELHMVSRLNDHRAWDHIRAQALAGAEVQVLLLHDAVLETEASVARALGEPESNKVVVMACVEDATRRQVPERWALVDYAGIIQRCVAADKVTTW